MLTYIENTDLFLAWIKAALPTTQTRSLFILQFGPKAPANNVGFLVLVLSFMHIFFFSEASQK